MELKEGQRVRILEESSGFFENSEGTIQKIDKDAAGNNIYGIIFYKFVDPLLQEHGKKTTLYYFNESEMIII